MPASLPAPAPAQLDADPDGPLALTGRQADPDGAVAVVALPGLHQTDADEAVELVEEPDVVLGRGLAADRLGPRPARVEHVGGLVVDDPREVVPTEPETHCVPRVPVARRRSNPAGRGGSRRSGEDGPARVDDLG